jgi:hypothetical protein
MRHIRVTIGLALLVAAGCHNWPHLRDKGGSGDGLARLDRPTPEQLVQYLNRNAAKVQGLECRQVSIDAKQGGQTAGLDALLVCQKPRDFRLVGRVAGNTEVDMGSNSQEFWYWIKRAPEPNYVYHCNYDDFRRGVRMPFPFQPDWIMEALGVATYDETKKYQVRETQTTVELIEQAKTPQGQPVSKVVVFNRSPAAAGKPQIAAFVLRDASGKEIATATVTDVQHDPATGAVVPRRINLVWPEEKIEMKMRLDGVRVGPIDPGRAASVFSRRNLASLPGFDLARGPDAPNGTQPADYRQPLRGSQP